MQKWKISDDALKYNKKESGKYIIIKDNKKEKDKNKKIYKINSHLTMFEKYKSINSVKNATASIINMTSFGNHQKNNKISKNYSNIISISDMESRNQNISKNKTKIINVKGIKIKGFDQLILSNSKMCSNINYNKTDN